MADRVVLHIGTMKSGTTYLQDSLQSGVLDGSEAFYAGGTFGAQTAAVKGMLGNKGQQQPRRWRKILRQVRGTDGVAIYSQEFIGFARFPRARQIVRSFGDVPVDVVLTVRDQHTAIPAQWQSFVRNRGTDGWEAYVRRLLDRDQEETRSKAVRSFLRAQDLPPMLRRWGRAAGAEHLRIVLVPPPGSAPAELWHRFCRAADLRLDDPPVRRSNESLGYASCEVMARLNARLEDLEVARWRGARRLMIEALLPLRPQEGRPVLDRAGAALADELNGRLVAAVTSAGLRVEGSLDELGAGGAASEEIVPADRDELLTALRAVWTAVTDEPAPDEDDPDRLADRVARRLRGVDAD